eukprot:CAMPEP_0114261436 /NCGR_PEP_ID=MMETSP0058-20121206/21127_1 /TAXON_ID=36894 /ORGANISM="Pyramimonas parkeae, CCMP726" /LENGTH=789 /DNA_ID=CAMNT_0001376953 /DNA_START=558 /DNA_END=2928 /DNA_ORIENTATION=+
MLTFYFGDIWVKASICIFLMQQSGKQRCLQRVGDLQSVTVYLGYWSSTENSQSPSKEVKKLVEMLCSTNDVAKVLNRRLPNNAPLPENLVHAFGTKHLKTCARVVEWARAHKKLTTSLATSYIAALQRKGRWDEAFQFFRTMMREGPPPNESTFKTVLSAYYQSKQWRRAEEVLREMREQGAHVDVDVYCLMMHTYLAGGQGNKMRDMLKAMHDAGLRADVDAYTSLIQACVPSGQWAPAEAVLAGMRAAKVAPNPDTFNALVHTLFRAKQWKRAQEVVRQMGMRKAKGGAGMPPGAEIFTTLAVALSEAGEWKLAAQTFQEMRQARLVPKKAVCIALLSSMAKANQWQRMQKLLREMEAMGVKPNADTYSSMIRAYGKAGEWRRAEQAHELMLQVGVRTDDAHGALVSAYAAARQWERAEAFMQEVETRQEAVSAAGHNALIGACEKVEEWSLALAAYSRMTRQGFAPTSATVKTMGRVYAALGQHELVLHLLQDALQAGVVPRAKLHVELIRLFSSEKHWHHAERAILIMQRFGVEIPNKTWNELYHMYMDFGQYAKADFLFDDEHEPRVWAYEQIQQKYLERDRCNGANRMLDQMSGARLDTMMAVYNRLFHECAQDDNWGMMEVFYDRMLKAGLQPNRSTYMQLMIMYTETKELDKLEEARKLFCAPSHELDERMILAYVKDNQMEWAETVLRGLVLECDDSPAYNACLIAYAKSGQWGKANDLFSYLKFHGVRLDNIAYSAVIHANNAGHVPEAGTRMMEEMRDAGMEFISDLNELSVGDPADL